MRSIEIELGITTQEQQAPALPPGLAASWTAALTRTGQTAGLSARNDLICVPQPVTAKASPATVTAVSGAALGHEL